MRKIASAVGLILLSTALSLLAGELLLRIVLEPANFLQVTLVDDPVLGHRIEPHTTGHDALGFRNARVPEQADVVAVGDSQTYGVNATRDGSWPHQLGLLLGQPVYSMAIGGYGPMDYLYLIQHDAPKLRPKQILVGFYFGNDLMDACWAVDQRSHWSAWRLDGVKMCEPTYPPPGHSEPAKRVGALRDWMASHSVLYGVIKATLLRRLVTWQKDQAATQAPRDLQMLWVDPVEPSVHTIFTPGQRLSMLDPKLRSIQEGMRITKKAFDEMRDETTKQGARLMIVLIPTKERVYCAYLKQSGVVLPDSYVRLCEAEEQVRREMTNHLASAGIRYVDVAGPLQEQTTKHVQVYPTDGDGHPLAAGYGLIAKSVYDALKAP
jgi:lysophospholipase L1-like esterase